jgi:UPF0755 protein
MLKFSRLFLLAVIAAMLLASVANWALVDEMDRTALGADLELTIANGASARSVLNQLAEVKVLKYPRLIEWYSRWKYRGQPGFKSGKYLLAKGSTTRQILEQLRQGRVELESVRLIEGWTFMQFRKLLAEQPDLVHDWSALSDREVMAQLGAAALHPEGRFFPDTYRFAAGTEEDTIYRLAYGRMQHELADAWNQRDVTLPLKNADELLTFASIVEKETGRADERAKIAGVFANRLRIGMRLQTDPTVIYGLGKNYDGDIRNRDIDTDTPYNTYTRAGLPPTPIAMPGSESLLAAAHPDHFAALYFVATGLSDGSTHFSNTLIEHNAAVARYLQRTRGGS